MTKLVKKAEESISCLITSSKPGLRALGMTLAFCKKVENPNVPYAAVSYDTKEHRFVLHVGPKSEELNDKQMMFLMAHEAMHLLHLHLKRTKHRDPHFSNIAQDCIINSTLIDTYGGYLEFIEGGCLIPWDYKGEWLFEELYDALDKSRKEGGQPSGNEEGGGNEERGGECPVYRDKRSLEELASGMGATTDTHMDISEEALEEAIAAANKLKERVEKNIGAGSNVFGELTISKLKPGRWAYKVKRLLSQSVSGNEREDSWGRLNRRGIDALPGYITHGREAAVLLDVSGSMGEDEFKRLLSQVLIRGVEYHFYFVDTKLLGEAKTKNIEELSIPMGGGTELNPVLQDVCKKHHTVIVMTDGYTDQLHFKGKGTYIVLYTEQKPPVKGRVHLFEVQ